jgi:NADH dehydrogenase
MLGGEICRLLTERKKPIRALVRTTSSPDKIARLKDLGVDIAFGDLKDRSSLDAACRGVGAVVTTASSTISRQEGDSIESVDRQGQLDLIVAAERAGVARFVLISFPASDPDYPLQAAKRAAEDRLRQSRLSYTILQPTFFMEVWLSPHLGFDPVNGTVKIYGSGENKISWISFQDVARFAVEVLDNPAAANATIELGGPDALSPIEVVRLAEQALGRTIAVQHVPEEALRAQHSQAPDSMSQTFAGLMLYYANGDVIDMTGTLQKLPVGALKSVRTHFQA